MSSATTIDVNRIDPDLIKPKAKGQSDFFSWQLYRWVKKRPHATQIWRGTWNAATGVDRDRPVLYIGHMDQALGSSFLHGRMLRGLCRIGEPLGSFAYGPAHDTAHWFDITATWWPEYIRIGVCAIHGDLAHNWDESNAARICRYCGKRERQITEMVERTRWVEVAA